MLISGAVGGYCCWQFSYPQDVIKTILQTTKNHKELYRPRFFDGGAISCALSLWRNEGVMAFWRGYLPCTIRALFANAILFVTYENCQKVLSEFHDKTAKNSR